MPRSSVWCVSSLRLDDAAPGPRPAAGAARSPACPRRPGSWASIAIASTAGRRLDGRDGDRRALRRQRVAGAVSDSLATAAMSPAGTSATGVLLLAAQGEQAVQALVGVASAGSTSWSSGRDRAREHLEQRHLADVGVGDRLEHERQRLARRDRRDLALVSPAVTGDRRAVAGRRPDLADELGQPVDADLGGGRAAHHGEHRRPRRPGRVCARAPRRRHLAFEVALHQVVVADDDALDEVVVHLVLEVGQSSGFPRGGLGPRRRGRSVRRSATPRN